MLMSQENIRLLKQAIEKSSYTVAICGSGMLKEHGLRGLKDQERAYDIETKYGMSPEYLYTNAYYSSRPKQFFQFYKNEMLHLDIMPNISTITLASMEKQGKLQCVITSNIYDIARRSGCKNVINIHGTIYDNKCSHCGKEYSAEYIKASKDIPTCESCGSIIRPQVSLFGEMLNNTVITQVVQEIERAEVLLILGTTFSSEVHSDYLGHFRGKSCIIIHDEPHYEDKAADIVIIDEPQNVLAQLEYS